MAVLVLVLWLFTAGAGFATLLTSNLGRSRPAAEVPLPGDRAPAAATATSAAAPASAAAATPTARATATAASAAPAKAAAPGALTSEELKQLRRERFDPPSLVAARQAPVVPGARALLEFAHPALGITGLAFWLGFSLVHSRILGWIAFGLVAVTACAGLAWFTANLRAAKLHDPAEHDPDQHDPDQHDSDQHDPDQHDPAPSFRPRMVAAHGAGAALTFLLAALTIVILH